MKQLFSLILIIFVTVTKAQCDGFIQTISMERPSCYAFSDGQVTVTHSGGTGPFTIEIKDSFGEILNFGGASTAHSLSGDKWYYCYVVDSEGCELYDSVYMTERPMLTAEYTITLPSSVALCDGVIDLEIVSEDDSLGIFWIPDPEFVSGLNATTYPYACYEPHIVTINDEHGCSLTMLIEVEGTAEITSNLLQKTQVYVKPDGNICAELSEIYPDSFINLYDITGKLILSQNIGNLTNIISTTSEGVIFYSITSNATVLGNGSLIVP